MPAHLLKNHCEDLVILCGHASNISEGLKLIKKVKPSLIYLDVEIEDSDAFEFLEAAKDFHFEIIFITAHSDFAVKAFRCDAVDYLLKPIEIKNLRNATVKAVNKINSLNNAKVESDTVRFLKENIGIKKIGVPVLDGMQFINIDDIVHCEAKANYSIITLINNKSITATKTLKDIEMLLPTSFFLRVHNSWIINIKYLKKYYKGKHSYMEMENGNTVAVSSRKKGDFLDLF